MKSLSFFLLFIVQAIVQAFMTRVVITSGALLRSWIQAVEAWSLRQIVKGVTLSLTAGIFT